MNFKNNNDEVIKKITKKSLKTNKVRNIFAICAIVLTTFMISSVFSIGVSFAKNYSTMSLRTQGTTATAFLTKPINEQIEEIKALDITESIGSKVNIGAVKNDILKQNSAKVYLQYYDKEGWEKQIVPCISDIEGKYPTEKNEIMASKQSLELLGLKDAKLNDEIEISYDIFGEVKTEKFKLSGIYVDFQLGQTSGNMMMSEKFTKDNNLSVKENGMALMTLKKKEMSAAPEILKENIELNKRQEFKFSFDTSKDSSSMTTIAAVVVSIIALFIVLSGYLLIYNVMYIAVIKDINFYGLLKTIGMSPSQIKRIVKGQILRLSIIGIPLGLSLGFIVSFGIVPMAMAMFSTSVYTSAMPNEVSYNPVIFIGAILFSLLAVSISCRKPAKFASSISPTEALRYSGVETSKKNKKNRNTTKGGKLYKMAWYNVFRDKKRAKVVFLSLFMGLITFLSISTIMNSISIDKYIDKYINEDFLIQNIDVETEEGDDKLSDDVINDIKSMEGIKTFSEVTLSYLQIDMNENLFLPPLKYVYESRSENPEEDLNLFLNKVKEEPSALSDYLIGIDENIIKEFNERYNMGIDVEAFNSGKLALIDSYYYPEEDKNINNEKLTIKNCEGASRTVDTKIVFYKNSFLPGGNPTLLGIPSIYVSTSVLKELDENPITYLLKIDVEEESEDTIKNSLKSIATSRGLWIEAKSDMRAKFESSQMVMNILGGGISVILILIGILNFINVMITGVNVRLKELAVMESIGMTKSQIKKMLTLEGFYYAVITTILTGTVGTGIICLIGELTKAILRYDEFIFPTKELIGLITIIFVVCLIIPAIVFKTATKQSVTERIREIEK